MEKFDMSDMYLYFGDVLNVIVNKFKIKSIHNALLAFSSLEELQSFDADIYSSTIYVFQEQKVTEFDLRTVKVFGNSNIYFSNSYKEYQEHRGAELGRLMTSIIINCDNLYNMIISNSVHKKLKFYIPSITKKNDRQEYINIKPPITIT